MKNTCVRGDIIILLQISKHDLPFYSHLKVSNKYPEHRKSLINNLTLFSIEQSANFQPADSLRLQRRASIHSLFPELGTPVTMVNSPGTT